MSGRVAVIGGGLGGLAAAGALAKAGCAVTLYEATAQVGGKAGSVQAAGVTLDTGPTLLTLPAVVRRIFETLGAPERMPRLFELDHHCRYTFADGRAFDVFRDLDRTADSVCRLDPREGDGVRTFYEEARRIYEAAGEPWLEAPFEGLGDFMRRVLRRGFGAAARGISFGTMQALAERHFHTAHLRQFVGRFATYAGASPWEASAAFALIPWLEHAQGVHHVEGGIGALASALAQVVSALGVELRIDARAKWERHGTLWMVSAAGQTEHFDAVVVNADPLARTDKLAGPLALSGYVLQLSVPERLALPHHTVLFAKNYAGEFSALFRGEVPDDLTLYVCHPAATDESMAAPGRSGLFVMANAPTIAADEHTHAHGARWAHADRVRALCLQRLDALWPGLAAKAEVIGERTPIDLQHLGAPGGSIYGFLPHGRLAPLRRPRQRGAPGLFYAGGGTHPGGGVPLVLLSGQFAAQLALEHLREVRA